MIDRIRTDVLAPRRWKQAFLVTFDFSAFSFALRASFCLRYDTWDGPQKIAQWAIVLSAAVVAVPVFIRMVLYRAAVRYVPKRAIWTMIQAGHVAGDGAMVRYRTH